MDDIVVCAEDIDALCFEYGELVAGDGTEELECAKEEPVVEAGVFCVVEAAEAPVGMWWNFCPGLMEIVPKSIEWLAQVEGLNVEGTYKGWRLL